MSCSGVQSFVMVAESSNTGKKLERQQRAFIAHIRSAHANASTAFYDTTPHRTWPWYVLMLASELDETVRPRMPKLSAERAEPFETVARQVIGSLRAMFMDEGLVPHTCIVIRALEEATPTTLAFERLKYYIIAELKLHLKAAFEASGEQSVIDGDFPISRRSARNRHEFPDPEQPAWATVNRTPSPKVQIPCRITPEVKAMIEEEAVKDGMSQSRWLELAIIEKLQRKGHAVEQEKPKSVPPRKGQVRRRIQRPSVPAPEKSVDASVNRADKSTTTRMGKSLVARIDKARGKKDRSHWMNDAIRAFFSANEVLPGAPDELEALSEPVALRFDRDFFPRVKNAARNSGTTHSEWYRRVARWYLEQNQ